MSRLSLPTFVKENLKNSNFSTFHLKKLKEYEKKKLKISFQTKFVNYTI